MRAHLLVVTNDPAKYFKRSQLVAAGMAVGFFLVMFLYSAQYFARRVYALIPYEFGGGQSLKVIFLLKPDAVGELAPVLAMDATDKESVPYYLLMETSDSYVVISQKTDDAQSNPPLWDGVYGLVPGTPGSYGSASSCSWD